MTFRTMNRYIIIIKYKSRTTPCTLVARWGRRGAWLQRCDGRRYRRCEPHNIICEINKKEKYLEVNQQNPQHNTIHTTLL